MMTILPTTTTSAATISEKRSFDSVSNTNNNNNNNKRVKSISPKTDSNENDFSSKMIIQLVKSAISALDKKNDLKLNKYDESPIDSLAHTISLPINNPKSINTQNLILLISNLTSEIARLDSKNALSLIDSILKINWLYHSNKLSNFSKNYATFLVVLVSTIPKWWNDVATKIILDFKKADEILLSSHHETLKKIISLAPTSSTSLPKLLKLNFPNKNSPKDEILNYVKNLLRLSEYYNVLINYIWSLIFENFIKLDVELQNQIDEVDDDDLSEVLGLDDSDVESDDDNNDDDSDDNGDDDDDGHSDDDDCHSDDSDDDDDDSDNEGIGKNDINNEKDKSINNKNGKEIYNDRNLSISKTYKIKKIKKIEEEIIDSDAENEIKSGKSSNVIKKVTFTEQNENDDNDDEFDDEMLDSEAEYNIELESLSELSLKLDNLLSYLLTYLKPSFSIDSLESGQGISIFSALTLTFRSMILPTHGTKASQYIIFYAAQQQPELIDAFLVSLFEIVFSTDKKQQNSIDSNNNINNSNSKITGVQYIASFVARAKNLSDTQIISVVTFLIDYCNAYMEEHDDDEDDNDDSNTYNNEKLNDKNNIKNFSNKTSSRSNSYNDDTKKKEFNPLKHSLFYSLIQALMYIICFRKDSLREPEFPNNKPELESKSQFKGTGWVAALDKFFTRVIVSKYDPLRWCNETVVLIFSRVAQTEGICYTWSVIERIRRERVGRINDVKSNKNDFNLSKDSNSFSNITVGTQSSLRATQEFLDLVAFFPFDPLLLKKSHQIVQDVYVEWDNGEDDNEESD